MLELADRLELQRFSYAGLSLGGMVGMWLAIHAPDRVDRLALLCTSAYLPPASMWHERAAAVRAAGTCAAISQSVVGRWFTPGFAARHPDVVASFTATLDEVDPEGYATCCEAIAAMDQREQLGRITAATLVIGGAQDLPTPATGTRRPDRGGGPDGAAGDAQPRRPPGLGGAAAHGDGAAARPRHRPGRGAAVSAGLSDEERHRQGMQVRREVLGAAHVDAAVARQTPFTEPFQDFITRTAWGDVWTRDGLDRRTRSMLTLTALLALGHEAELRLHVRAALTNGVTREEISEVFLHTAVYAGVPAANSAYAAAQEVFAVIDQESRADD